MCIKIIAFLFVITFVTHNAIAQYLIDHIKITSQYFLDGDDSTLFFESSDFGGPIGFDGTTVHFLYSVKEDRYNSHRRQTTFDMKVWTSPDFIDS